MSKAEEQEEVFWDVISLIDNDTEDRMTVQLPADSDDNTNEKENGQPQPSNEEVTIQLPIQSAAVSAAAPINVSDHGMTILPVKA